MKRACFTVQTSDGINRDANHLSIGHGVGANGLSISVLTFFCSGSVVSVPADLVKEIRFHAAGATWCDACDERIQRIGEGIHADVVIP